MVLGPITMLDLLREGSDPEEGSFIDGREPMNAYRPKLTLSSPSSMSLGETL